MTVPAQPELTDLLERVLGRRRGVLGALIATSDGLPQGASSTLSQIQDGIAACAATQLSMATSLTGTTGIGAASFVRIQASGGDAYLTAVGDTSCLVVLAEDSADPTAIRQHMTDVVAHALLILVAEARSPREVTS